MSNEKKGKIEYYEGYGANFRKLRTEKGMTLVELGKEINYSDRTLSMIETEERAPTAEQVTSYHKFFNASYDYLLGEAESPRQDVEALINEVGLSPTAWSMIYGIKADDHLQALDLIFSNPIFLQIINLYSVMIELWQNSNDCINNENDLKRHNDLQKFIEEHQDKLEEIGAYAQLINDKEDVQRRLKCIRHDIDKLQRKLQDEIVYSITGLRDT